MRVCACCPARHSTAPIVNSATGVAESASMLHDLRHRRRAACSRPRATQRAERDRPGQRVGQRAAQRARSGAAAPCCVGRRAGRACSCASARHSELVTNRSTSSVPITGPAARLAEQADEQRHAHEAGVRKGRHERAEGGVLQSTRRAFGDGAASARS